MDIDSFNWFLAVTTDRETVLDCVPKTSSGQSYGFELTIWHGNLSKFNGEILHIESKETVEMSGDDIFILMDKMQQKTMSLYEG